MTPYQAHRDARLIELDMIDCCELVFEGQPMPDYRPLLKRFSDRVGQLADRLQQLEQVSVEQLKAAERWKLLYETPGIKLGFLNNRNHVVIQEIPNGQKIIGQGSTLIEAVDKALGFK